MYCGELVVHFAIFQCTTNDDTTVISEEFLTIDPTALRMRKAKSSTFQFPIYPLCITRSL